MTLAILLTLAGTLAASFFDLRSRRVPNALTATLAVGALLVQAFNGPVAALTSLAIMAALTLGGTLVYARGGIGGGDIKLAIAAAGMLGYPLCLPFLLYSALAGGLLAIFYLLFRPESRPSLSSVALMASGGISSLGAKRATMPYALAFTLGAITVALAQSVAPFLRITL
ncbi:MAG TPA: prepilin peptidase [Candidatus Baltobacteraceae bacterium]|jgi:prepilin peptidase CpaA|nr:prepilin peptidase [Candidatus Baltobacteraceae bacterium]